MFEVEEILHKVQRIVEILKPNIQSSKGVYGVVGKVKGMLPEYYPGYNHLVEDYNNIRIHSDKGVFPGKLFAHRSPNQTQEELDYIRDNYKQTTLPVFLDYINSVTRPFHRSNWSIKYQEDDPQFQEMTFQDYVERGIPGVKSLESFMRHVVPPLKAKDPEGVIAIKPASIPVVENEDGELVIADDQLLEPAPQYYNVEQVVDYEEGKYALIELAEKSPVTEGKRTMMVGLVYEFYDKNRIWKVIQVGKRTDFTFVPLLVWEHNMKEVPVTKLKGVPTFQGEELVFKSPFLFAVDNLDLVVLNQSNLQASINKCVYPYRVMIGDYCDFEDDGATCQSGYINRFDDEKGEYRTVCPKCQGSGLKSRVSPMGELLLKPTTRMDEGDQISEPMKYVSPETNTLEFLRSEIKEHEVRARKILHLRDSETRVNGSEDVTATEVGADLKALASFVEPISDQTFDLYSWALDTIGTMRYGASYKKPQLLKPTTFDYTTEADYILQIKEATEAGAPPIVLNQIIERYLRTIFFTDAEHSKAFELVLKADRLLGVSSDQINLKAGRGGVAVWEDIIHCSAPALISELIREDEEFLSKPMDEQITALEDLAKAKATALGARNEETIIDRITAG